MSKRAFTVVVAVVGMLSGSAYAQNSKNAMQVGEVSLLKAMGTAGSPGQWSDIFSAEIKTSQPSDLQIGVSLEAGLFTDTLVRSKTGTTDTSVAEAMIEVQVLIDGKLADPGIITYARRAQTLMARFGGILQDCKDANGDGTIAADECNFTDEELRLILDTMNANAFFFALPNVGVGNHRITVQARVKTSASWQGGAATASASIGKGAVVVEEVKYIRNFDVTP